MGFRKWVVSGCVLVLVLPGCIGGSLQETGAWVRWKQEGLFDHMPADGEDGHWSFSEQRSMGGTRLGWYLDDPGLQEMLGARGELVTVRWWPGPEDHEGPPMFLTAEVLSVDARVPPGTPDETVLAHFREFTTRLGHNASEASVAGREAGFLESRRLVTQDGLRFDAFRARLDNRGTDLAGLFQETTSGAVPVPGEIPSELVIGGNGWSFRFVLPVHVAFDLREGGSLFLNTHFSVNSAGWTYYLHVKGSPFEALSYELVERRIRETFEELGLPPPTFDELEWRTTSATAHYELMSSMDLATERAIAYGAGGTGGPGCRWKDTKPRRSAAA